MNSTDGILRVLNGAVAADADAVAKLVSHRVVCTNRLADHPTIQCGIVSSPESSDRPVVGMLGIINGIAAELDGQVIRAVFDDEKLIRFEIRM